MRLVGDLFAYVWSGRDNNCNSYVLARVLNDDRHVVIDPGHVTTPALREAGLERLHEDGVANETEWISAKTNLATAQAAKLTAQTELERAKKNEDILLRSAQEDVVQAAIRVVEAFIFLKTLIRTCPLALCWVANSSVVEEPQGPGQTERRNQRQTPEETAADFRSQQHLTTLWQPAPGRKDPQEPP